MPHTLLSPQCPYLPSLLLLRCPAPFLPHPVQRAVRHGGPPREGLREDVPAPGLREAHVPPAVHPASHGQHPVRVRVRVGPAPGSGRAARGVRGHRQRVLPASGCEEDSRPYLTRLHALLASSLYPVDSPNPPHPTPHSWCTLSRRRTSTGSSWSVCFCRSFDLGGCLSTNNNYRTAFASSSPRTPRWHRPSCWASAKCGPGPTRRSKVSMCPSCMPCLGWLYVGTFTQ